MKNYKILVQINEILVQINEILVQINEILVQLTLFCFPCLIPLNSSTIHSNTDNQSFID